MRQFLAFTCIFLLLSNCTPRSKKDRVLTDLIPTNSAIMFKTSSLETLESEVKNNGLLNILSNEDLFENFKTELKKFDRLGIKNEAVICISSDQSFSIISYLSNDQTDKDSLQEPEEIFYKKNCRQFYDCLYIKSNY